MEGDLNQLALFQSRTVRVSELSRWAASFTTTQRRAWVLLSQSCSVRYKLSCTGRRWGTCWDVCPELNIRTILHPHIPILRVTEPVKPHHGTLKYGCTCMLLECSSGRRNFWCKTLFGKGLGGCRVSWNFGHKTKLWNKLFWRWRLRQHQGCPQLAQKRNWGLLPWFSKRPVSFSHDRRKSKLFQSRRGHEIVKDWHYSRFTWANAGLKLCGHGCSSSGLQFHKQAKVRLLQIGGELMLQRSVSTVRIIIFWCPWWDAWKAWRILFNNLFLHESSQCIQLLNIKIRLSW